MKLVDVTKRLWPAVCVLCSGRGASAWLDMCVDCRADLPRNERACVRCAEPLAVSATAMCGACLGRPPRIDATLTALRYAFPVDRMIRDLKYGGGVVQGRVLGELLASHLMAIRRDAWPDSVVPMPLARQRFGERGYNQAIEIASVLEKRLPIRLHTDLVVRVRETREQAELDRKERRRNLRNAFAVRTELPGPCIAIVDDVITTGSTMDEVARVLKKAGAERVEAWAVARAGRPQ